MTRFVESRAAEHASVADGRGTVDQSLPDGRRATPADLGHDLPSLDDVEECAAERMASASQGARGDLGFAIRAVRHVPGLRGCASQMVPWPSGVTARTALQRSDSAE